VVAQAFSGDPSPGDPSLSQLWGDHRLSPGSPLALRLHGLRLSGEGRSLTGDPPMILTREFSRVAVSYAHLRTTLAGLNPRVSQVGIMTAWNPDSTSASPEENAKATKRLLSDLRKHGLGKPISIGGFYEELPEGSFLIPNVTREYMVMMCRKYGQSTVIYGERTGGVDEPGMLYEMVNRKGEVVLEASDPVSGIDELLEKRDAEGKEKEFWGYSYLRGKTPQPAGKTPKGPNEQVRREYEKDLALRSKPRKPTRRERGIEERIRRREIEPGGVYPAVKPFVIPFKESKA